MPIFHPRKKLESVTGRLQSFCKHKFTILIDPENPFVFHELGNFLRVGKKVRVSVNSEFSMFHWDVDTIKLQFFLSSKLNSFKVTNF